MPELPDVEIFKQYLDATSLHRTIERVDKKTPDMLKGISGKKLQQRLEQKRFNSSRRHGKYLFAELKGEGWLVLHFGMTGFLKYYKIPGKEPAHDRLRIGFANGYHLAYDCQRKLGEIGFADGPDKFIREREMGPDAMSADLDLDALRKILSGSRASIKGALMNQSLIAGLGNVYTDEILFQAGIHPKTKANELEEGDVKRLYRKMRKEVLPTVIDRRADPARFPEEYLTPCRKKGANCPRCGSELKQIKVSGRTAYLCPECQQSRR